ncbi:hypothetical protein CD932_25140 [Janthinobacterium sp. PC23-8]|nr:hypothetical protein CD932_25140 [Janthinobacterium sp. PC23-8]
MPTMTPSTLSRHAPSLLLVALLHLFVIYLLLQSKTRLATDAPGLQGPRIQWLRVSAPKPAPAPASAATPAARLAVRQPRAPRQAVAAPISQPAPAPLSAPDSTAEPAPAVPSKPNAPSAAEILAQAKRDVGQIDKDLRKQFPQRGEQKIDDTAFKRMQQGFADAYAAVPPKWYEASRIEELGANTPRGGHTYKITSPLGTLCVTTGAGKNGETMIGNCPK